MMMKARCVTDPWARLLFLISDGYLRFFLHWIWKMPFTPVYVGHFYFFNMGNFQGYKQTVFSNLIIFFYKLWI